MSGSKPKASTQNYNTGGLYGDASTGKNGTSYNPSSFETNLVNQTKSAIPEYLQQLVNPVYDSNVFKAQTAQRNRLANQSFENNVINPLASRGLTRGSSVNQMSGQFANKLADLETDAMSEEDKRVAQIVDNLMSYYQVPYNMMSGMTNQTNSAYQNAVNAANQANANSSSLWGNLAKAGGTIGGAYFGPGGAYLGNKVGETVVK